MRILITLLLLTISFQYLSAQESLDSVSWTPDQGKTTIPDSGEIINETFEGIELKLKGNVTKKIRLEQIQSIEYANEPSQYTQAKQSQESGKYAQSVDLYTKSLSDSRLRTIYKQHILYNIALSYQLSGQFDKALQSYEELFKAYPQSRYFREAYFNKSQCAAGKGDLQMASDILDDAKAKAKQLNVENKFLYEIDLRKAMLLEDNNKIDDAKAIYNRLTGIATKEPSILYRAWVGVGRCEIANKNSAEAEKAFNEVIEKSDDALANAGAYNGRAACILARSSSPDAKVYKNALFDYLRSKTLYPAIVGQSTVEEEKAIYYAGYCFEKLAQAMATEKKKVYINNARALYQELKQKFPTSKLVPEANKHLQELGK